MGMICMPSGLASFTPGITPPDSPLPKRVMKWGDAGQGLPSVAKLACSVPQLYFRIGFVHRKLPIISREMDRNGVMPNNWKELADGAVAYLEVKPKRCSNPPERLPSSMMS
jgi:hypothetical protein